MPVPETRIEAGGAEFTVAAIAELKDADPDAWRLFGGGRDGHYALWAHLAAEEAAALPIPLSIDVIDDLTGSPGRKAFLDGCAPSVAVTLLAGRCR
jgi:hypothetical protein